MTDMEILELLDKGEINVRKACNMLKSRREPVPVRKGHFIKISVLDESHRFKFYVPIALVSAGMSLGRLVTRLVAKHQDNEDLRKVCKALDHISGRDLHRLVRALQMCKTYPFIDVYDQGNHVQISVV